MNFTQRSYMAMMLCLFMASGLGLSEADTSPHDLSKVQAKFEPHFELGYILVSIANPTNELIKIAHDLRYDFPPMPENADSNRYYVSIVITQIPNVHIDYSPEDYDSMAMPNGVPPPAQTIGPGETKLIKFTLAKYLIKVASHSSKIELALSNMEAIAEKKPSVSETFVFDEKEAKWKEKTFHS